MRRVKPHLYRYNGWWAIDFPEGTSVIAGEDLGKAINWLNEGIVSGGFLLNMTTGRYHPYSFYRKELIK